MRFPEPGWKPWGYTAQLSRECSALRSPRCEQHRRPGSLPGAVALPVLHSPYELEPRPHRVHRRHPHVHETMGEPDGPDHVLGEIGRHAGRLLGPGDPQHARGRERALERREATLELALRVREELNEVERAGDGMPARHARRQLSEDTIIATWCLEDRDPRIRLDPQLGDQRLARVPSHLYRPLYITRQIVPPASSVIYSDPSGPTATPTGRCFAPDGSSFPHPAAHVS